MVITSPVLAAEGGAGSLTEINPATAVLTWVQFRFVERHVHYG